LGSPHKKSKTFTAWRLQFKIRGIGSVSESVMVRWNKFLSILVVSLVVLADQACAEGAPLSDRNNDGQIEILAFGDSITYGVGDGTEPGQYISELGDVGSPRGYPLRLSAALSLPVMNAGIPGEMVVGEPGGRLPGVARFPEEVVGSPADLVIIFEGANDARIEIPTAQYEAALQRMINVARADNKSVALATLLPPTVQHGMFAAQTALYSGAIRQLGVMNNVPVIDLEQGFLKDCPDLSTCPYYNLPEGLHPNTVGYDAIARMVAAGLQG
jgi:lysophospholipase L1-like esterase